MSEPLDLQGRHIVLGLSGGIACFKSAELVRELVRHGASVQVVMTEAATQFITPVTMQALSNRSVYTSQWDPREPNAMAHINLTREADAVLVAPASADFMAKLLHGRGDDLLSLLCLARPLDKVPLLLAPAMNREMWAHPATRRNVEQLRADGATVFEVGSGDQACGESGDGRMLEAQELLDDVRVELRQAIEMVEIADHVLSDMMDAFASIVSNNLNSVMKVLTSVTIILAVPTLIASVYGMNVGLPGAHSPLAFAGIVALSVAICGGLFFVFRRRNWL